MGLYGRNEWWGGDKQMSAGQTNTEFELGALLYGVSVEQKYSG